MGKIRVQDLAEKMGVPEQDLLFKLKSIGVRVEGEDALIDTDIIQAILQGKKLPQPQREVILRDESAAKTAPTQKRRTPPRRPAPPSGMRQPGRRRSVVHKAEPKIKTLPSTERPQEPEPTPPPVEEVAPAAASIEQPEAQAKTEAPAPSPPVPDEPKPAQAPPEKKSAPVRRPSGPVPTIPVVKDKPTRHEKGQDNKRKRQKVVAAQQEDLRAYKGAVDELPDEPETPVQPAAAGRRKRRAQRKKEQVEAAEQGKVLTFKKPEDEGPVTISEGLRVRDLAEKLGIKSKDLIKKLISRGIMANVNQVLEPELAQEIAEELGFEAMVVTFEEEVQLEQEAVPRQTEGKVPRAPVVTIMGHVDHGKTSLLDHIRSSRVTESEYGGITQHIGAYSVETKEHRIVFLDTPGHEAFTKLRARGAKATDIVVLVVAADDGVMPQTIEAIDHARAAKVPMIVAINKMDKDNANPDRVKRDLSDHEVLVEDWGGDVVAVPISAIKGEGIPELLEMIVLTSDMLELRADPELPAQGVVLEARKAPGKGTVATVLVQNGTLDVGDVFVSGSTWGRVRAMFDDLGNRIDQAEPATPVEVAGFNDLPEAGDTFQVVVDEAKARSIADFRREEQRQRDLIPAGRRISLENLYEHIEAGEVRELPVILKADVQGSVEVLRDSLEKLSTDKVKVRVIRAGVGAVTTHDVLLASASEAIIYGFNVRPERNAVELADKEDVDIRTHTVIYELNDELRKAMTGLLEPTFQEVEKGRAEVRETFKVPKIGTVAGCHVIEGVIPRNARIRLLRDNVVIHEGRISSLRRFKDDAAEVRSGFDCGIGIEQFQDLKPGDMIEAFVEEAVAPTL